MGAGAVFVARRVAVGGVSSVAVACTIPMASGVSSCRLLPEVGVF